MAKGRMRWLVVALAVVASSLVLLESSPVSATGSYADLIESRDPVRYFRLGESSSATAPVDEMGGSNTGWVDPSLVTYGVSSPFFGSDTAGSLSSSGDAAGAAAFDARALGSSASASLEAWVKPSALPSAGHEANIVAQSGCCMGYTVAGLRMALTSSGTVVAEAGRDGDNKATGELPSWYDASFRRLRVESKRTVAVGSWYHVVAVYDDASKSVWVSVDGFANGDGRDNFTGLGWNSTPSISPHWMGIGLADPKGYIEGFTGAIDEVAVYDEPLSLTDIRTDFLASGQSAPSGWNVPEGVTGRPSLAEISAAMENGVPSRVDGRQGVFFDWDGVRVVINEAQPWRSSAWYPGR